MAKTFKLTKDMQSKNLKRAALAYAEVGVPVFPVFGIKNKKCLCGNTECEHQGKHPIPKKGFKEATTDLKQIEKWWSEHPNANIASPLVEGLFALDFDGVKGKKSFEKLGLEEFKTLCVKTGNGFHLYVHAELKAKNSAMSGLDIRGGGEGGYIILPPSRHVSGVRYTWDTSKTKNVNLLSNDVIRRLLSKNTVSVEFSKSKAFFDEGTRNDHLFKLSCSLRRQDVPERALKKMLHNINKKLCKPPLSNKELNALLKSSNKYDDGAATEFCCMSEIKSQKVKWFWYPYMPRGSIIFLDGHPGRGKSFFTLWLAALCSNGGKFPFSTEKLPKGRVLILNAEDDPERTMRPRLEEAGADLSPGKIHFQGRFKPLSKEGIQTLEAKISSFKPDLVIIDPLLTYMSSDVDAHRFDQVTKFLTQIDEIARDHSLCVIAVRHMTKSGGEHAINKGLGSIGFAARARSVLHIGAAPDDPDVIKGFAHVKSNWAEKGPTLLYKLEGGSKTKYPKLVWIEVADYPAEKLDPIQSVGRPKVEPNLSDVLMELLVHGPMKRADIDKGLIVRGIDVNKSKVIRELRDIASIEGKGPKAVWRLK